MSDYHQYATTLALQKLAAWAFAIGERPRLPEELTGRRPHRGQLPDVDFDSVTIDANHRPLWSRIADLVFGRRHRPVLPADIETVPTGERPAGAYIGKEEAGGSTKEGGSIDPTNWSRAA